MVKESRIDYDASQHTDFVTTQDAELTIKPYNIFMLEDVLRKEVADVGCGDGSLARFAIHQGASRVHGIDNDPGMIRLARKRSEEYNTITYEHRAIENYPGEQNFDIAICSYLFNNASSYQGLLAQAKGVASLLKPNGKALIFNSNPFDLFGGEFPDLGYEKRIHPSEDGLVREGSLIEFICEGIDKPIKNYWLTPETHRKAFTNAGFSRLEWKPLVLPPHVDESAYTSFQTNKELPVIAGVATKGTTSTYS